MSKVSRKQVQQLSMVSSKTAGEFLRFIEHFNKLMPILDKRVADLEATVEILVETLNIKLPQEIKETLDVVNENVEKGEIQ